MSGERRFERKHVLLAVLVVVAVAAIPGRMAWSMRSDAAAEADTVRAETAELQARITKARKDQKRSAELNAQLEALAAALPPEPDLASVLEQLSALATEANVSWTTSAQNQPIVVRETRADDEDTVPTTTAAAGAATATAAADDAAPAGPPTSSYLLEVDLEGTPGNLTTYLEKLRSLPRLITVERMTWTWREGASGQPNSQLVAARVTLKAYTWTAAPKAVPGAAPTSTPATPTTTAP